MLDVSISIIVLLLFTAMVLPVLFCSTLLCFALLTGWIGNMSHDNKQQV
jgi:hypothetical protein